MRCFAVVIFFPQILFVKSDANELTILLTFSVVLRPGDLTRHSKNCIMLSGNCSSLSKLSNFRMVIMTLNKHDCFSNHLLNVLSIYGGIGCHLFLTQRPYVEEPLIWPDDAATHFLKLFLLLSSSHLAGNKSVQFQLIFFIGLVNSR